MKKVKLGKQGLEVSPIGLGCMGMSEFYGSASEQQNLKVLDYAANIGSTFWDTSDMYGPFTNEVLLGQALKGKRDKITLASKFGISRGEDGSWKGIKGNAEYVKSSCEASLKRLGTDYIDLYYLHRLDPETPIEETRDVEEDILPTIKKLSVGFVAYSPLGRGFLTGNIRSRADLEEGDWRLDNPRFTEEAIAHNVKLADLISEISNKVGATPAQVALTWLLSRDSSIAEIPGTRKIERLKENVSAQDLKLPNEHLDLLNQFDHLKIAGNRY